MSKEIDKFQLLWGIALVSAGLGVFYRIPQVVPRLENIIHVSMNLFFMRFCFYLLGILLIAGGSRKLYNLFRSNQDKKN